MPSTCWLQTHQTLYLLHFGEKNFSALGACSGTATLARTFTSHDAALQEKMLHCSVLVGFSTHHKFQKELMPSTEVPLYTLKK